MHTHITCNHTHRCQIIDLATAIILSGRWLMPLWWKPRCPFSMYSQCKIIQDFVAHISLKLSPKSFHQEQNVSLHHHMFRPMWTHTIKKNSYYYYDHYNEYSNAQLKMNFTHIRLLKLAVQMNSLWIHLMEFKQHLSNSIFRFQLFTNIGTKLSTAPKENQQRASESAAYQRPIKNMKESSTQAVCRYLLSCWKSKRSVTCMLLT